MYIYDFRAKHNKQFIIVLIMLICISVTGCSKENNADVPEDVKSQIPVESEIEHKEIISQEPPIENSQDNKTTTEPKTDDVDDSCVDEHENITSSTNTPAEEDLVRILDYIPTVYVDLKYATEDNFTGKVIYDFSDPYLRYGTVKKLMAVQDELLALGYSLKIWDAYRPVSAQFTLWEICPDPNFVSNPNKGYSSHSRGNTVDVTIVMADGSEIEMPTEFDEFSSLADRDYSDVSDMAKQNVLVLESAMSEQGFNCYFGEWWHYSDSVSYPVVDG